MNSPPSLLPTELIVVTTPDEYSSVLKKYGLEERVDPSYQGLTRYLPEVPLIVVFIRPSQETLGVCIHEAVHVWQYSLEYMSESEPGWEIEAYSIQKIALFLIKSSQSSYTTNNP